MSTTSAEVAGQTAGVQARNVPATETVLRPAVDIFEDADGITLYADIPGVSKERLNVHLDGKTLLLEGTVQFADSPLADSASAVTRYRRSFTLSRELEPDRIEAKVNNGVLTLRIPKRAESRPRKIEIQ